MEQDDRSYHTADRSPPSYTYTGQPHLIRGAPQTYYELAPLMEHSLSTHYPQSSQRSIAHTTSYSSPYNSSPFRGQSYDAPGGQFVNNSFQHTSLNHTPSHGLHPFSDLAAETNSSALRAEAELYRSSTPRTAEVGRAYTPGATFISQSNTSTNHFAFSSAPSNAYVQAVQPSAGCATNPVVQETTRHLLKRGQIPHAQYPGDLAQAFTPPQLPFDRKHMYTRTIDAADDSAPDPPVKPADLDDPQPYLPLSHQFPNSNVGTNIPLPEEPVPPPVAIPKKKKSKMHDCEICHKKFPRPSGLRTHMNIHNNVRPYPCTYPGCTRRFAVRSNAKRHLRTHGIIPAPATTSSSLSSPPTTPYVVGFNPPTIVPPSEGEMHHVGHTPVTLKWMPPSLFKMSNVAKLRPISDIEESDVDDEDDEYDLLTLSSNTREESIGPQAEGGGSSKTSKRGLNREGRSALSIPLRPVVPTSPPLPLPTLRCAPFNLAISSCGGVNSDCYARYEERNSFREAGSHPYHPSQFRVLPGPAVIRSSLVV